MTSTSLFSRGRLAPSPTGPLHFGSLVAAVASFCEAKHRGGEWLIRVEDIDPLREVAGASVLQLTQLAAFGLTSDAPIIRQSERRALYVSALNALIDQDLAYPCDCSRQELAANPLHRGPCVRPHDKRARPAHSPAPTNTRSPAWRVRAPAREFGFDDHWQGPIKQHLADAVGDFVVWRTDDWVAYQLAVVVDDAAQNISEVVRGADLLESTPRQIFLQQALGLPTPRYAHTPMAVDANGSKLSKSEGSLAIDHNHPLPPLRAALRFLGQDHLADAVADSAQQLLQHARLNWRSHAVPQLQQGTPIGFW